MIGSRSSKLQLSRNAAVHAKRMRILIHLLYKSLVSFRYEFSPQLESSRQLPATDGKVGDKHPPGQYPLGPEGQTPAAKVGGGRAGERNHE